MGWGGSLGSSSLCHACPAPPYSRPALPCSTLLHFAPASQGGAHPSSRPQHMRPRGHRCQHQGSQAAPRAHVRCVCSEWRHTGQGAGLRARGMPWACGWQEQHGACYAFCAVLRCAVAGWAGLGSCQAQLDRPGCRNVRLPGASPVLCSGAAGNTHPVAPLSSPLTPLSSGCAASPTPDSDSPRLCCSGGPGG